MSTRLIYFFGLIVIGALLATSVYLQIFDGIMPCPLCTLQRLTFGLLGILFFFGAIAHKKRGARIFIDLLLFLTSALGLFFAGRQIWLQHFPPTDGTECGVSIQYMMQALPLHEVAQKVFTGSAECTQRGWEFLMLNMAEWALIWFGFFLLVSIYLIVQEWKKR